MAGSRETREEQTALRLVNGWPKVRGAMVNAGGGWGAQVHEQQACMYA